jgi:hypothetical protein
MQLTKRGQFVIGALTGALIAIALNFFLTHHTVVDKDTCKQVDVGIACDFHYERNK